MKVEATEVAPGVIRIDSYSDITSEHWHRATIITAAEALELARVLARMGTVRPKSTKRRRHTKETKT